MFEQIVEASTYLLNNYPLAQPIKEYLDSRLSTASQDLFQFGYFPNMTNLKALTSIIGEDLLKHEELIYTREIEDSLCQRSVNFLYFENYPLIFPFKDPYGKIVALVGRTLLSSSDQKEKHISKYMNTKNFKKGNNLFGLFENKQNIIDNDLVYVVEGQFDLIKAREVGLNNVVALGSSSMTAYQFSLITRYTSNIILLLDNDEAGNKGRYLIKTKFGALASINNFYIPKIYNDIDEYISTEQITSFKDMSFNITTYI